MKTIVISGVNLFEGGPLSIYKDCLDAFINNKLNVNNNIIAFVYKKELFIEYSNKITLIELPNARKNYFYRLYYEYIYFYFYSIGKHIDVWLSLHDITPNVKAKQRYVYCHNASPFMKTELKNLKYSYKNFLFSLFYKYLYKINIRKNTAVIVQQDWIRKEFIKMYKTKNVIVARPLAIIDDSLRSNSLKSVKDNYQFVFPAYPRFFKNFEVVCAATKELVKNGFNNFKVILTIDGNENIYSNSIVNKYGYLKNIDFIGIQKREMLMKLYSRSDCLIFPSKLETWGLPITEFKVTGKPIILANLPYSFETIGSYDKCTFFNPESSSELAKIMESIINGNYKFQKVIAKKIDDPYTNNWADLLEMIVDNK